MKTISKAEGGIFYDALELTPAEVAEKMILFTKSEEAAAMCNYA